MGGPVGGVGRRRSGEDLDFHIGSLTEPSGNVGKLGDQRGRPQAQPVARLRDADHDRYHHSCLAARPARPPRPRPTRERPPRRSCSRSGASSSARTRCSSACSSALLAGGHVLLEGVPGLAKTLTIKTLADVARRLVQAHPVHARPGAVRPRRHAHLPPRHRRASTPSSARSSATSCSPTRSTARPPRSSPRCSRSCRSARSRSATTPSRSRRRSSSWRPQNPIESEGTYPLPEAQVDRFMIKIVVDYPTAGEEAQSSARSLVAGRAPREILDADGLAALQRRRRGLRRPAASSATPSALVEATRRRPTGRAELEAVRRVRRQPARLDQPRPRRPRAGAPARSPLRPAGRRRRARAPDVLRHRLVLSYAALADGVTADTISLGSSRPRPGAALDMAAEPTACTPAWRADAPGVHGGRALGLARSAASRPARPGPGPIADDLVRRSSSPSTRRVGGRMAGDHRGVGRGRGPGARPDPAVRAGRRRPPDRLERHRPDAASRRSARTCRSGS